MQAFKELHFILFRFLIFATVLLNLAVHTNGGNVKVRSYADKILVGYNYRNISIETPVECLQHCLADCICMSFQICNSPDCQLSSAHQYLDTNTALQDSEGCHYQDFEYNVSITEVDRSPFRRTLFRFISNKGNSSPRLERASLI
jgi:hypothetical protein